MKIKFVVFLLLFATEFAFAQSPSESSTSESYSPKGNTSFHANSGDYYRTESGQIIDVTANKKADAALKKVLEAHGFKHRPMEEGSEDYVDDTFSLPAAETLLGCVYTKGYSYPSLCRENGKIVFNSSKDTQKTLDKIIDKQKKRGKYNKIPGGGPVIVKGVGLD